MKWRLMYVPWPLKVALYLGGLLLTARLFGTVPFPVFAVVLVATSMGMHYVLGPHPDLVRPELRPARK